MHISYRFIFAECLDCMQGTPPMSSYVDKTGVKLIIITVYRLPFAIPSAKVAPGWQ